MSTFDSIVNTKAIKNHIQSDFQPKATQMLTDTLIYRCVGMETGSYSVYIYIN